MTKRARLDREPFRLLRQPDRVDGDGRTKPARDALSLMERPGPVGYR